MEKKFHDEMKLDDTELSSLRSKILKIMCPSKDASNDEQMGYYNYYCQYYFTDEEEHKVEAWIRTIDTVYWNMTKRIIIDFKDLMTILVINDKNYKAIKQILEILETRKGLVRASKIFNGKHYETEDKKYSFWGANIFK